MFWSSVQQYSTLKTREQSQFKFSSATAEGYFLKKILTSSKIASSGTQMSNPAPYLSNRHSHNNEAARGGRRRSVLVRRFFVASHRLFKRSSSNRSTRRPVALHEAHHTTAAKRQTPNHNQLRDTRNRLQPMPPVQPLVQGNEERGAT